LNRNKNPLVSYADVAATGRNVMFAGSAGGRIEIATRDSCRVRHVHAGVLGILSLICQLFMENAVLGTEVAWLVRIGVPLAGILIPLGLFLACSCMVFG